jgi:hypothetical protein
VDAITVVPLILPVQIGISILISWAVRCTDVRASPDKGYVRLTRSAFCLIVALLFSGCAVPYATVMKSYRDATTCCASMGDFVYEPIAVGDSKNFDLNEKSPAYPFDTGKSFLKAFKLPQSSYPYVVSISSYMLRDHLEKAYIFFPHVITLDEEFKVVRSRGVSTFHFQRAGFLETTRQTWGLMYKVEGQVYFTEDNISEKYCVILTTDELLGAKSSVETWKTVSVILPGVVGAIPIGTETVLVPHSPFGRISISVRTAAETPRLVASDTKAPVPDEAHLKARVHAMHATAATGDEKTLYDMHPPYGRETFEEWKASRTSPPLPPGMRISANVDKVCSCSEIPGPPLRHRCVLLIQLATEGPMNQRDEGRALEVWEHSGREWYWLPIIDTLGFEECP